jgi:hypothetical protein
MPGETEPAAIAEALTSNLASLAQEQLLAIAEDGKAALAGNIDNAARLIGGLGDQLEGQLLGPLAPVLGTGAGWLEALADDIARRDVTDLVAEGRALLAARPELAVAGAGLAGLVLGRIIRAGLAGRRG